ncbi:hypothetical protein [Desulfurispira natronophila]|uniref:Uncharacterized protein n=1 Tax=Desulfurispira natronophila TaxID=682562 RepID=A0A7W8DGW5_9BACT|nr:hypothetical protein [Desulfurispira natronophila]MBB5021946.1 hypothetical protein [Desulfurispira natronophila]
MHKRTLVHRYFLAAVLFAFLLTLPATAQAGRMAAGFSFGETTGLSFKYWQDNQRAIDMAAGWGSDEWDIKADYLFHEPEIFRVDHGQVFLYYGMGFYAQGKDDKDDIAGARVPFGVEYFLPGMPLSFFGDVAPAMDLSPETSFGTQAHLGMRYIF